MAVAVCRGEGACRDADALGSRREGYAAHRARLQKRIVHVAGCRLDNHNLTACIVPPLAAFLDGALAGAALIVLAEDRQSLDTRENREGCDGANRAKRPSRPKPELSGREARLNAFPDRQAHSHGIVGVELDRGAGSDTQHAPVDLLSVCR